MVSLSQIEEMFKPKSDGLDVNDPSFNSSFLLQ